MSQMFIHVRAQMNSYGKRRKPRPKSSRPETFTVTFALADGTVRRADVPVADYPFALAMPIFDPPGIYIGGSPTAGFPNFLNPERIWLAQEGDNEKIQRLYRGPGAKARNMTIERVLPIGEYYKLLAKIAYTQAIATAANDAVRQVIAHYSMIPAYLRDLDGAPSAPYLVGCSYYSDGSRVNSIATGNTTHETIVFTENREGEYTIFARIQLWAKLGAPVYEVVVARFRLDPTYEE